MHCLWYVTFAFFLFITLQHVIDKFDVEASTTRVAIVSFGTAATVDIDDVSRTGSHVATDRCSLYRRLGDALDQVELEGHTATGEALRKVYDILLRSRPGVKKAVILVTDGR